MNDSPAPAKERSTKVSIGHIVSVLLTGVVCFLAIVQVMGRVASASASAFTPYINTALIPYRSEVTQVSGDWQGFNPVLRIERLSFAAGYLQNVYIELDFFQTIANRKPIFRRFFVKKGEVGLIHTPQGWALKNNSEQPIDIDFYELLSSSKFVDAVLGLSVERANEAFRFAINLTVNNDPLNKYGRLVIDSPGISQPLALVYDLRSQGARDERLQPDASLRLSAEGGLQIPAVLLGGTGVALEFSRAKWHGGEGRSSELIDDQKQPNEKFADKDGDARDRAWLSQGFGIFDLDLKVTRSPYLLPDRTLTLGARVSVWSRQGKALARVQSRLQTEGATDLLPPSMLLEVDWDRLIGGTSASYTMQPSVRIRTQSLDLGAFSEFADAALSSERALGEWLIALDAQATLTELIASYTPSSGLSWWSYAKDVQLSAYRGSPGVINAHAEIYGDANHIGMQVKGDDVTMSFPAVFSEVWEFDAVSGELLLLFKQGYASVRGSNVKAVDGRTHITGGFATSRPEARFDQRISLSLQVDDISAAQTRRFIPYKLNPRLRQWLLEAPLAGDFSDLRMAHHGQIHIRPSEVSRRRFELQGDFQAARLRYEDQWPLLLDANGSIHVAGRHTYGDLQAGKTAELDLSGAKIHVDANQSMLFLSQQHSASADTLLTLVRQSPLQQSLSFVSSGWSAEGEIFYNAEIGVPLGSNLPPTAILQVAIDAEFDDLDLAMPDYRLAWRSLAGQQRFSLPHNLEGGVSGLLFGNPVDVRIDYDPQFLRFDVAGQVSALDIFRMAAIETSPVIEGQADFVGRLQLDMVGTGPAELRLSTDFEGMAINLPAQFGKDHGGRLKSVFDFAFADDYLRVDWQYKETEGWYQAANGLTKRVSQGAIGVNALPLEVEPNYEGVVINGRVSKVDLADWVSTDGGAAIDPPVSWQMRGLQVDDFIVDDLKFLDLELSGQGDRNSAIFQVRGEDVSGSIDLSEPSQLVVDLLTLRLPGLSSDENTLQGNHDPIDLTFGRALPRAKVFVNELIIGEEPFGRWKFEISPESGGVRFDIEDVLVNGVAIKNSALFWDLERNKSAFSGAAYMQDLAEVLPLWGYAPAVTSKSASVTGNLSWAGSPANLDIIKSEGGVSLAAMQGRFLDVESAQAGLRVLSLLNITALTKRISFDFSDVVGEGISFEEVFGDVQIEGQKLSFTKNLIIKSTSSRYEFGGEVDLSGKALDAEMIVTLPVGDSLPWYAAYLAFANPIAGLSVAVGERVFRKPIERMSSAKFVVSGTLDDPEVTFTELFNKDIKEADAAGERLSPDLLKEQDEGASAPSGVAR